MVSLPDYICHENESYACLFSKAVILLLALKFIWTFINGIKVYFLAKPLGLTTDLKTMGSWAVVTGGTDGIGKGYAEELAKLGLNICIISRSQEKLDTVAGEIESKYKVKMKTIRADFSHGLEIYETIAAGLKDLEIGVLVNNVGISLSHAEYFMEINDSFVDQLLKVNVESMNKMVRIVLPKMIDRKCGVIINISSGMGTFPAPLYSIYSASKSYVNNLSQCLREEYKSKGIIIQTVYPFLVATNMTKFKKTSWIVPNGNTFARSALSTIGVASNSYGYWSHALQAWIFDLIPECVRHILVFSQVKKMRAAALRKLEKTK